MAYEIYTYGGGETLWYVFNAVVTMMSGGTYIMLIKIAGICALFWVIAQGIFKGASTTLTYLLVFIIVYGIMFVPKVNVVIVDRVVPQYSGRVVANVPWGLGFFAHLTSKIGDSLTRTTESTFTLPNSAKYLENGMLFNTYIMEAASQWVVTDETFSTNLQEYMRQCVFYDILLKRYTWKDLTTAKDLWGFIWSKGPSVVRGFKYVKDDTTPPVTQYTDCMTGHAALNVRWQVELANANNVYGKRLYPHLNVAQATARLLSDLPSSYEFLMKYSSTGADLMRQNLMINMTRRAIRSTATKADATASVTDFAQVQAETTLKVNQETAGRIAAKTLPLFKNILEAIIYAAFPFVLLMMLLPVGGGIFIAYASTLLWVQLWAPLYAVLNLFMELYAEDRIPAAADVGTGSGPTIATNTGILHVASDTASIAGYLSLSIPVIAWMLVAGGKIAATQVASAVMGAAGGAASQSAPSAASGNIKLGELGAYNTSMFQNRTSPVNDSGRSTFYDNQGNKITRSSSLNKSSRASETIETPKSSFHSSHGMASMTAARLMKASSHQRSLGKQWQAQATRSAGSLINVATSYGTNSQMGQVFSRAKSKSVRAAFRTVAQAKQSFMSSVNEKYGIKESVGRELASKAEGGIGFNIGILKLGMSGTRKDFNRKSFERDYESARQTMTSSEFVKANETIKDYVGSSAFKSDVGQTKLHGESGAANYARLLQFQKKGEAAFAKADQYSQQAQHYSDKTRTGSADLTTEVGAALANVNFKELKGEEQLTVGSFYLTHGKDAKRTEGAWNVLSSNRSRIASGNQQAPAGTDQSTYNDAIHMYKGEVAPALEAGEQKSEMNRNKATKGVYNQQRDIMEKKVTGMAQKENKDAQKELAFAARQILYNESLTKGDLQKFSNHVTGVLSASQKNVSGSFTEAEEKTLQTAINIRDKIYQAAYDVTPPAAPPGVRKKLALNLLQSGSLDKNVTTAYNKAVNTTDYLSKKKELAR